MADSFTLEAAKLISKTSRIHILENLVNSLLKNEKVLFAINRADVTSEEVKKLFASQQLREKQIDFSQIVASARNWAVKEGRGVIDKLDILLAIIDQSPEFKSLLFKKEIKEEGLLNIIFWARTYLEKDPRHFWEKPVETLGPGISEFWLGGWTPETESYALDLTKNIRHGKSTPVPLPPAIFSI